MNSTKFFILLFVLIFSGCKRKKVTQDRLCSRINLDQIVQVIPTSSEDIYLLAQQTIDQMEQALLAIEAVNAQSRTYVNTLLAYEKIFFQFFMHKQIFSLIARLSSQSNLQTAAHVALLDLQDYQKNRLEKNEALFEAFCEYEKYGKDPYRKIKPVAFFLQSNVQEGVHKGFDLSPDVTHALQEIEDHVNRLAGVFAVQIMQDNKIITVSKADLHTIADQFAAQLVKDEAGNAIVPVNEKNYQMIMNYCSSCAVRREMFQAFVNKGYPSNIDILKDAHQAYGRISSLLESGNMAQLQLDGSMLGTVKKVDCFLHSIAKDLLICNQKKINALKNSLPYGVCLNSCGQIQPWDFDFVCKQYSDKYFNINDAYVAEHFPLEATLHKILQQLSKFFFVTFEKEMAPGLWADNIICYRMRSLKHQGVIGYIFFDLYKRFAKVEGSGNFILIPAIRDDCSIPCVGASVVYANFDIAAEDKPACMTFQDLESLIKNIGKSLHDIFGATRFTKFSGSQVAWDIESIGSSFLSYWVRDKNFLQMISGHYKTKVALDKHNIEKLIARHKFFKAFALQKDIYLSLVALNFFTMNFDSFEGSVCKLHHKIIPYIAFDKHDHFYLSMQSLLDQKHGALLYAPVWSELLAANFFEEVRKEGILNHEVGIRFVTEILGHGGSKYGSEMVKKFLMRSLHKNALIDSL